MRIGIDTRLLQSSILNSGIGVYTYNLVKNILKICEDDVVLYALNDKSNPINELFKHSRVRYLPGYKRLNLFFQQLLRFNTDVDVYHIPMVFGPLRDVVLPIFPPHNTVITIHDLIPYYLNDAWSVYLRNTRDYRLQLRGIKRVKKIITVSKATKNDIIEIIGVEDNNIRVIYEGVDRELFNPLTDKISLKNYLKGRFGIQKRYLLCVGTVENKNLYNAIKAFQGLNEKELQLVVVGNMENISSKLLKSMVSLDDIVLTNELNTQDTCILYNCAELLLFVSTMEGFGLPILEAFACGCPVITSNTSSLPEVAGDAAVLVNPTNVEEIKEKIKDVVNNIELRESLIAKGLKRVEKFSWLRCAEETLEVYREIVG